MLKTKKFVKNRNLCIALKLQLHQCEFIILTFGIDLCGKNLFLLKLTLV